MTRFYFPLLAGFLFSLLANAQTVTDIDGNVYTTMTYGSQVWMTENLRTTRFQNGTLIPNVLSNTTWTNLIQSPGRCYPVNDSANTANYGTLYNFHAISNAADICPAGWHVPTDSEWNTLAFFLDPTVDTNFVGATGTGNTIGNALKDTGTTYWDVSNTGTNTSGFNGRGAGYRQSSGSFNGFRTFA
jgi:uncharacterized protein (TIGR02145 family)